MKKFLIPIALMVLIAGLSLFACRTAPDVVRVKMDYAPTNLVVPPKTIPNSSIYIGSFEDRRKTPDQIGQNAAKIAETVGNRYMPIGNLTQMTDDERALVAAWFAQGAKR